MIEKAAEFLADEVVAAIAFQIALPGNCVGGFGAPAQRCGFYLGSTNGDYQSIGSIVRDLGSGALRNWSSRSLWNEETWPAKV